MGIDYHEMTPAHLVDLFISDCTLPSTKRTEQASYIYDVFEEYCNSLQLGVPCSIHFFGKLMGKRFQKRLVKGLSYYYMEFRPGLFDVTD